MTSAIAPVDYLRIERALCGLVPVTDLTPAEQRELQAKRAAFEIGRLAFALAQGYYAHAAAMKIAGHPDAMNLVVTAGSADPPVGLVPRADGSRHVFDLRHYLDLAKRSDVSIELSQAWLGGSLLTLGEALKERRYLGHAPLLELVYHLRNGIAHGNRFNFTKSGLDRLSRYPAHNRGAFIGPRLLEVTASLKGQRILFDFMGPADVLDLLTSVEVSLTNLRTP